MKQRNTKDQHLRIRITTEQYIRLCQLIVEENISKSQFIRSAIDEKLNNSCRVKNKTRENNMFKNYTDYIAAKRKIIQ